MKIKNLEINKKSIGKLASFVLAGSLAITTLTGCSSLQTQDVEPANISASAQETKGNELPSYYNCYNVFENQEMDKMCGVTKLTRRGHSFIDFLCWPFLHLEKVSVEDVENVLNLFNSDQELAKQDYNLKGFDVEVLSFDGNSLTLKYKNKNKGGENLVYLVQTKDDDGCVLIFDESTLKKCQNSSFVVTYSNDNRKISTYDKLTGDLTILKDVAYLGCDDEIISFARIDNDHTIYHFDMVNKTHTQEMIEDVKIQDTYVSYKTGDGNLIIVDLLTTKTYENELNQDNFWVELSDGSLIYGRKTGDLNRFQQGYRLKEGNFDEDSCVLSNLCTYPEGGCYTNLLDSYYFNNKLDVIYEVPNFEKMLENNADGGYIKYCSYDGSDVFLDLTSGKLHYLQDIIKSNDYTIYNTIEKQMGKKSLFKDKTGKTVATIDGNVREYFDDEKIAIKSSWVYSDGDNICYFDSEIVDLSDFNNPKTIMSSGNKTLVLYKTPIDTVYKAYKKGDIKYFLIDIEGNTLAASADSIRFETPVNTNDDIGHVAVVTNYFDEYTENYEITFDTNGKVVNKQSYQKIMRK